MTTPAVRYRTGTKRYQRWDNHCTVYAQEGEQPSAEDELVGTADDPALAAQIVAALNGEDGAAMGRWRSVQWCSQGRLLYVRPPAEPLTDFVASLASAELAELVASAFLCGTVTGV